MTVRVAPQPSTYVGEGAGEDDDPAVASVGLWGGGNCHCVVGGFQSGR